MRLADDVPGLLSACDGWEGRTGRDHRALVLDRLDWRVPAAEEKGVDQHTGCVVFQRPRQVKEHALAGGNTGGAVRIGDTVRRAAGPWTPAVHALLRHPQATGFAGATRALGCDDQGREILSFLPGNAAGDHRLWPSWVHSDEALVQVARWLRDYHRVVADFQPPPDAVWREGAPWRPGLIVGHNDAAPSE